MAILKQLKLVSLVWKTSFKIMSEHRRLLIPFGVNAVFQGMLLLLLFWAPQFPFSIVLAPPIRAFFGELYLHYPANFLLMPRLFNYGNIIISLFITSCMTGMMVSMIHQVNKNVFPGVRSNFKKAVKKYVTLVALWIVVFILVSIVFRGPKFFILKYYFQKTGFFSWWNVFRMAFTGSVLISILIEMFFGYAAAAVMIEGKSAWQAIKRSFFIAKKFFFPTFMLVAIPVFFIFLMSIVKWKIPQMMKQFFPEMAICVLVLGVIVSLLVNYIVTASVTILFLMNKEIEEKE